MKKRYMIGFILLVILGAVLGYNYIFLPNPRFPVIKFCDEQFIATQNGTEKAECYEDAAVSQHNPEFCAHVGIGTWRESDCIKAVLTAAPDDPAVYKKLRNPYLRGMFTYHKLDLPAEEFNPSYSIDEYFLDFITNKTDLSAKDMFICKEINNIYLRSPCYNAIAIAEKDISICNKIPRIDLKDHCHRYVAWETLDAQLCKGIVDIEIRSTCYREVAERKQDSSICEKIEIIFERNNCYQQMAEVKHDTSICDKIQNETIREYCHFKVQRMA